MMLWWDIFSSDKEEECKKSNKASVRKLSGIGNGDERPYLHLSGRRNAGARRGKQTEFK